MESIRIILAPLLFLSLSACATNAGIGAISGLAVGGGVGGAARGGPGGLIGAASGIIAGTLIGAALDVQDRKVMERTSPRTVDRMDRGEPLTLNDIIKLSQGGVNDDTIMHYIRDTDSHYTLSQAQIRRLRDTGVSSRVLNFMIDTGQ